MLFKEGSKLYYNGKSLQLNNIGFRPEKNYKFKKYFKDKCCGDGICIIDSNNNHLYLLKEMKKYFTIK